MYNSLNNWTNMSIHRLVGLWRTLSTYLKRTTKR